MIKVIELSATIANAGPIGPLEIAICKKTNPVILIELPIKPTIKILGQKLLFWIQIGIEINNIREFIIKNVRYVTRDGSNPIFSVVICLVRIPFQVTISGKINANEIGTQAGINSFPSTFLTSDASLLRQLSPLIRSEHAVIVINPII